MSRDFEHNSFKPRIKGNQSTSGPVLFGWIINENIMPLLICIFLTACGNDSSVGIIEGADGPSAILVSEKVDKAMYEQKRYVEITTSISTIIVLTAGIILSYVYGIYYYQKNINDVHYLKRNKFSLREFKQLIIFDALYQMLINFLFALPIVVVISYFGQIFLGLAYLGIIAFSLCVVFQLVTLPTEFNASRRAMVTIENENILDDREQRSARKVLSAAAMTYVAALAVAIMQLLRLVAIVARRRD